MARLSEQTERFEDMITYMKKYIENAKDLKDEERNLLSIAYKNAVGSRRTAWRAISAFENKEKTKVKVTKTLLIFRILDKLKSLSTTKLR